MKYRIITLLIMIISVIAFVIYYNIITERRAAEKEREEREERNRRQMAWDKEKAKFNAINNIAADAFWDFFNSASVKSFRCVHPLTTL